MSTMAMKLKTKNGGKNQKYSPFLARQMSKWFYDISTSTATGAAHCGSFDRKCFGLLVISYR
jgi:hypothetical protein